jgi:hypothetical protein
MIKSCWAARHINLKSRFNSKLTWPVDPEELSLLVAMKASTLIRNKIWIQDFDTKSRKNGNLYEMGR